MLCVLVIDFLLRREEYNAGRLLITRTGFVGLTGLMASFACTPLAYLLRLPWLTPLRRTLGLYGFLFAGLHVAGYAWLDNDFALPLILRDLGERPSMSVGLSALALLIPLAVTSTRGWQRRLGPRWRRLHRLVYIAVPLAVAHFLMLDRDIFTEARVFAGIAAVLLGLRIWFALRRTRKESG